MTDWPKLTPDQTSDLQSLCHLVLLRGIELGLEAAAQAIKALREDCDGLDREMAFEVPLGAVQDLNPDTIAKEAKHD